MGVEYTRLHLLGLHTHSLDTLLLWNGLETKEQVRNDAVKMVRAELDCTGCLARAGSVGKGSSGGR